MDTLGGGEQRMTKTDTPLRETQRAEDWPLSQSPWQQQQPDRDRCPYQLSDMRESVQMLLLTGWLTSQKHACVSRGQICSENCTSYHNEIKLQTKFSQHTDTRPISPNADPKMQQVAGRVPTRVITFKSPVWLNLEKDSQRKQEWNPGLPHSGWDSLLLGQRGDAHRGLKQ